MSTASNNGNLQSDTATGDETAERILDGALTLFLEFGYRRTTMETVARRLGALSIEENPVVEGFVLAVRLARQHALIRRLIDTDPEWLLMPAILTPGGILTSDDDDELRRVASYLVQPLL